LAVFFILNSAITVDFLQCMFQSTIKNRGTSAVLYPRLRLTHRSYNTQDFSQPVE
jgi:hypothetical protein